MADYLGLLASQLEVSIWAIIALLIWEAVWTGIAMWKSAKNNHLVWFIIFFLVNIFAIPEIIYIFWFSKKVEKVAPTPRSKRRR
ncbi:MAG: DUF5652 family protein [Nanoarchaeota archaeon]